MPKDATVAVLGSEPEIYFYAQRHSATGYIYTYGLVREQKLALAMQRQMIQEIETSRPEFLVFVGIRTSWLLPPGSANGSAFLSWAQRYMEENYELTGIADILDDHTEYRWGSDARYYKLTAPHTLRVFKRKSS
jgi:hypothetical protein